KYFKWNHLYLIQQIALYSQLSNYCNHMVFAKTILSAMISLVAASVYGQTVMNLYNGPVPNSKTSQVVEKIEKRPDGITRVSGVTQPQITAFLADKARNTGQAVIIF